MIASEYSFRSNRRFREHGYVGGALVHTTATHRLKGSKKRGIEGVPPIPSGAERLTLPPHRALKCAEFEIPCATDPHTWPRGVLDMGPDTCTPGRPTGHWGWGPRIERGMGMI